MTTLEISTVEVTVKLSDIRRDEALICRAKGINAGTVKEYAAAMKGGTVFPPVVLFRDGKGVHWLADGFHRCGAAELAGIAEIAADVREGGRREALLHAASANAGHGLRRTSSDKRKAVALVLAAYPKWSDRKIGDACGCDHKTVAAVRRKAEQSEAGGEIPQATPDAFDDASELARARKSLAALEERWPRKGKARASLAALLREWADRVAPERTNGKTSEAVAAASEAVAS